MVGNLYGCNFPTKITLLSSHYLLSLVRVKFDAYKSTMIMLTNRAKFPYFAIKVEVIKRHDISFYVIIDDINKYDLFSRYRITNVCSRQNNIFIAKTVYVLPRP